MTTLDLAGLCERLRATEPVGIRRDQHKPINPDGPEAAAAIERLAREVRTARNIFTLCTNPDQYADASVLNVYAQMREFLAHTAIEGASDDR